MTEYGGEVVRERRRQPAELAGHRLDRARCGLGVRRPGRRDDLGDGSRSGRSPTSETSTCVRCVTAETLTTLATMSPLSSSRVTTWKTSAAGARVVVGHLQHAVEVQLDVPVLDDDLDAVGLAGRRCCGPRPPSPHRRRRRPPSAAPGGCCSSRPGSTRSSRSDRRRRSRRGSPRRRPSCGRRARACSAPVLLVGAGRDAAGVGRGGARLHVLAVHHRPGRRSAATTRRRRRSRPRTGRHRRRSP